MNLRTLILTKNRCYKANKKIIPKGIMVHSTGANNPNLRRYVGPDDGYLGVNVNNNHWNRDDVNTCVHAFIGKLKDGSIATYQTLPWNHRGWHCGGKGNDQYISFEICEDNLLDPLYFQLVYNEAVELTAYLCKMYNLDPLKDGVVICHSEGFTRGIASNHSDIMHWFPKYNKSMDIFRKDVASKLKGEEEVTQEQFDKMMDDWLNRQAEKSVSDWAKSAMESAVKSGITDGSRPQSFATRQEVITMLNRK